jgi:dephospho-CoA kinase
MLKIGLTGGIGSGKSVVADMLAGWGAPVIDTDRIAHQLTGAQGAAMPAIEAAFGAQVVAPGGALDRDAMRALAFRDAQARGRLEAILHPMISAEVYAQAAALSAPYAVFAVPLLVEAGERWISRVDRVCVVDCSPQTQVARVQARSGLTPEVIERIMSVQSTRQARLAVADDVVDNGADVTLEALRKQVGALHESWLRLAQSPSPEPPIATQQR